MAPPKIRTKRKAAPASVTTTADAPTAVIPAKKKMAKGWVELDTEFDESVVDPQLRNSTEPSLSRTRPGNATKQPGLVDKSPTRRRRSAAEVAKDKSDRAEQSRKDHEELLQKRKAVAELEDAMAIDEDTRQASATKPVPGTVTAKVPRPVAHTEDVEQGSGTGAEAEGEPEINDDFKEHKDSEDYDGVTSSPLKNRRVVKPKKQRGDQRALIEQGRLTESRMGDLFVSMASDTSKRKLVNPDAAQLELQPPVKKIKAALPSGLLDNVSVSRVSLGSAMVASRGFKTPTGKNSASTEDPDFSLRYGGIQDGDLAESAPPVGLVRAAGKKQNIAKVIRGSPAIKIEAMEAAVGGRPRAIQKKESYNQGHLPAGTIHAWKTHIIPSWRNFAGTQQNAWQTTAPELCDDLKEIWDIVFPTRKQEVIDIDSPIFVVAIQRWYEWRGNIGRAVLFAVNAYMTKFSDDVDTRAAHATYMKGDAERIPFAWKEHPLSPEDPQIYKGLFLSHFVLVGLAAHFNMTSSVCPELEVDGQPCGALAIATVGAERAFNFWVTGNSTANDQDRKEEAKFSEDNWGLSTLSYISSISKLTLRQWAKINTAASELMATPKQSISLTHGTAAPSIDARGCLFEEDSEVEE